MKHVRILTAFVLIPFLIAGLSAQDMITGTVASEKTGEPLIGVNVYIEGTNVGAATDIDGNFRIAYTPTAEFNLTFGYMGYKKVTLTLAPGDNLVGLAVALVEDVFRGEEVVVTGFASSRAVEVAEVAVSRISVAELTEDVAYGSLATLLHGKAAGVDIKKSSGNVGVGYRFDIRSGGGLNGNEQPVIYVDGVRMDSRELTFSYVGGQGISTISDLNPEDIESIDILKGPAAASTYGTNGSNGVVLITTKRGRMAPGKAGKPFRVDYKYITGMNTPSNEYDTLDVVSAKDANAAHADGLIEEHNVSITGGSPAARYFVSFSKHYEEGITINKNGNYQDRSSVRANFDAFPANNLTFNVSTSYSLNEVTLPQNDNNIFGWLGNTLLFPDSYLFTDSVAIADLDDITKSKRFIGSIRASYTPFPTTPQLKGLKLNASVGIDDSHLRWDSYMSPEYSYGSVGTKGARYSTVRQNQEMSYNFGASFSLDVGAIQSVTSFSTQIFDRYYRRLMLSKQDYKTPLITNIGAGEELKGADEFFSHRRDAGLVFTESITALDQFFITLSMRNDFASSIGPEAESIYYPGAQFAWRLDRIGLLPSFVNMFKLRTAYGQSGILPGSDDAIRLLWEAGVGGDGVGGLTAAIGNPTIEPERLTEFEIGIDGELFGRLLFELTLYKQSADSSIIGKRNAPSTGLTVTSMPINIGAMEGSGMEALVKFTPINTNMVRLDLTASHSINDNEVLDLGGAQPIYDSWENNVIKEGQPKHAFFVPKVLGATFNDDGTYKGVDLAETPDTTDDDRFFFGVPHPTSISFLSTNLKLFKNFNFYVLVDSKQGNKMYNYTRAWGTGSGNIIPYNNLKEQLGISDDDPDNDITPLTPGTDAYEEAGHAYAKMQKAYTCNWIEDASFVKLREVSVSYSFRDILSRLGLEKQISDLSIGFSALNLRTWTDYKGIDPELNWNGATNLNMRGQDFLTMQSPTTYNFSVRVSF